MWKQSGEGVGWGMLRVTCGSVHRTSSHFTRYDTVHYTLLAGDGSTVVSDYSASTDKRTVHGDQRAGEKTGHVRHTSQLVSRSLVVVESTRPLLIGL